MQEVRLIDANALHDKVSSMGLQNGSVLGHHSGTADIIAEMIQNAPTIDPESLRPVAHWAPVDLDSDMEFKCSKCEFVMSTSWDGYDDFNYCPCCGAKMVGDEYA